MAKYITILAIVIVGILLFKNQDVFLTRNDQNTANVSAVATAASPAADESDEFVLADIPKPKASVSASKVNGGSVNPVSGLKSNVPANSNLVITVNSYIDGKYWYTENFTYPYKPYGTNVNVNVPDSNYVTFVNFGGACKGVKCSFKTYSTSENINMYYKSKYITVKTYVISEINPWVVTNDYKIAPIITVNKKQLPFDTKGNIGTLDKVSGIQKFKAGTKLTFRLDNIRLTPRIRFDKWKGACSNVSDVCIIKPEDAIKDISVTAMFSNHKFK